MRLFGFGRQENVIAQVDKTHGALRTSIRPLEKGVLGSYSVTLLSGAFTAGAVTTTPVCAFQWTSAAYTCLLRRAYGAVQVTTAFAQGAIALDLIRAKSTGSGQYTGGTTITIQGSDQVRSTRFATTQQRIAAAATGAIAMANTAALSAPGTAWTFDSNPVARLDGTLTTGLPTGLIFEARAYDEPLEFRSGEGFLIRATWPGTGVVNPVAITLEWDEIDPSLYFGNL